MNIVNVISSIIDGIQGVIDGDITLFDIFKLIFNTLSGSIYLFLQWFFSQSKDLFINLGKDFTSMFQNQSFLDNWLPWILGLFIGIFVLKYVITAVIELISKFIDIT